MAENEEFQAPWQSAGGNSLNNSFETNNFSSFQDDQQEEVIPDTSGVQAQGGLEAWETEPAGPMETGWRLVRQFSPVLVPLLFAIITFIFVALLTLRQKSFPPPGAIISFSLLLIALAAVQAVLMYYAGSNDGLWSIYIISGFCLFLLVGTFAALGFLPGLILFVVLVVIGILFGRYWIRITSQGSVDIVEAFGKYTRTLEPGLNVLLPWEKVVRSLSTQVLSWSSPMQRITISQSQVVQFIASVDYQLLPDDAYIVALNLQDWEKSVQDRFITTTQSVISELSPQDFVVWQQGNRSRGVPSASAADLEATTRWDRINTLLMQRIQESVAEWGVQIHAVGIRDLFLTPYVSAASAPQSIQQKTPAPTPAPTTPPPAASALEAASLPIHMDTLTSAYGAVRQGLITDPETIRSIARRFDAVASNPEEMQKFGYDAGRAAQNLYSKAQQIEGQRTTEQVNHDSDTQPDWPTRRPANNNLMMGG